VASLESFRDTETMGYIANQATTMIIEALGAGSRIQNTVAHSTTNPRQGNKVKMSWFSDRY